ncbi:hypothetical protein BDV59DRAFT_196627 [Aspergillus ambiguus]|uniref:uncharacterized protein n=1 Tax=Aspergillus ambiguus TaxID=176160 RepID=UPI003CCD0FE5
MPSSLDRLPVELLHLIIKNVRPAEALTRLSCTNRRLRTICIPYIFDTVKVTFSKAGFERLEKVSQSFVGRHVRVLCYEAPELIDPNVESFDYFCTSVYTPSEYIRDLRDLYWNPDKNRVSYQAVHSYFAGLACEQQELLANYEDLRALKESLPRLRRLGTIRINFVDSTTAPFRWFSNRVFVDWKDSFPLHLEAISEAMIAARNFGVSVHSFSISGFYSEIPASSVVVSEKVKRALRDLRHLHVIDSPSFLKFISAIRLPALHRLELERCCVQATDLERFICDHAHTLRFLHLEDVWLPVERRHEWGISLYTSVTKTSVAHINNIRRLGILRELTINKAGSESFEHQEFLQNFEAIQI